MTDGQYRALVAYLNYWTTMYRHFDLDHAIRDIGIRDSRADVIEQLAVAGHEFDEATGLLVYRP